ncbi:MAG: hypothetical protein IPP29_05140 [Bacteroidetes bacterium]|nr:hypothetical protein [Bacteroidota bacterium]
MMINKKIDKPRVIFSAQTQDNYMAFMAEWIAFNAICYNLYNEIASIDRANIDRSKSKSGLNKIHKSIIETEELEIEKAKISFTSEKWNVDLSLSDSRLFISVSNNYTEDIIFHKCTLSNQM